MHLPRRAPVQILQFSPFLQRMAGTKSADFGAGFLCLRNENTPFFSGFAFASRAVSLHTFLSDDRTVLEPVFPRSVRKLEGETLPELRALPELPAELACEELEPE